VSEETKNDKSKKDDKKADHEPPAGAETTATWRRGRRAIQYTATAKWIVLRKKEKPAAEIFSVSYIAGGADRSRPVTFVFNGGPGASSAYLHMGAVGPQRVDFPADGTLPALPARLVVNESSWLAFTDLVFVDPVGTGFSRIIEPEKKGDEKDKKPEDAPDPKEYFGYKRDLESLCEFMGRWLSDNRRWGSPVFIAGESYGGYRVGRLARVLQESAGIGLNGAVLISPALEISALAFTDYDVLSWIDRVPTMAAAAMHHRAIAGIQKRNRARARPARVGGVRHRRLRDVPDARRCDAGEGAVTDPCSPGRHPRPAARHRAPIRGPGRDLHVRP
jgi:carboxypeptidase C (cathepsin A)